MKVLAVLLASAAVSGLPLPLDAAAPAAAPRSTASGPASAPATRPALDYTAAAREVTRDLQARFYLPRTGLYAESLTKRQPDFMWGNGIAFAALLAAAREDQSPYARIAARFFTAMDAYWDKLAPVPGYEPAPTRGNGNDKYYDDNAWLVLSCLEAYELTGQRRYLDRAEATLKFVLSGWDDQRGGGIWWHEGHKDGSKNTCVNAPAAVGCLWIARHQPPERAKASVAMAKRIVEWTQRELEADDGLYFDNVRVDNGKINHAKLTYNTALMIRAFLGLHAATGDEAYLKKAERAAAAADWFLDARTGVYRDAVKWSHLMVEADVEMYRATRQQRWLDRARQNADGLYAAWKLKPSPEMMDNASVARLLWLVAYADEDPKPAKPAR